MSDESVLNQKALDDIRALQDRGSSDLLTRIISMFFAKTPTLMDEIKAGIEQNKPEQLWTSAHALKSSSASVGATRVYDICAQLESMGRAGELESGQGLFELLQQELALANTELKTYLDDDS